MIVNKGQEVTSHPILPTLQVVIREKRLPPPPEEGMDKGMALAFVKLHGDAYTAIVAQRKAKGKKLPFLEHLKHFLGLTTLALPPRSDKSPVTLEVKTEFVAWLQKEKHVTEAKSALNHYYQMTDLVKALQVGWLFPGGEVLLWAFAVSRGRLRRTVTSPSQLSDCPPSSGDVCYGARHII